jgi:hypothetical protein
MLVKSYRKDPAQVQGRLRKLDRPVVERIKAATGSLRDDPRPAGAEMLTGMHRVPRINLAGDGLASASEFPITVGNKTQSG